MEISKHIKHHDGGMRHTNRETDNQASKQSNKQPLYWDMGCRWMFLFEMYLSADIYIRRYVRENRPFAGHFAGSKMCSYLC